VPNETYLCVCVCDIEPACSVVLYVSKDSTMIGGYCSIAAMILLAPLKVLFVFRFNYLNLPFWFSHFI